MAIVFTLLAALFEGFGLGFLLSFLQSLTDPNAAPIKTGVEWLDVWVLGVNASSTERLYRISGFILLTTLVRLVFSYFSNLYSQIAQFRLAYHLRLRLFEQLQSLSLSYFANTRSGELVNSFTNETTGVIQAVEVMNFFFVRGTTIFVYLLSMFLLSSKLTIASLMLFSLLSVGISTLLGRVREASFIRSKASGHFISTVVEFINGIRTIRAAAAGDFERKRFYRVNAGVLSAATKSVSLQALVEPLAEGVATTILILMLILAFSTLIPSGQLQTASLLTFLFILFRMMPLVKQLNGARAKMSSFQGSIANLREVLKTDGKPYAPSGWRKMHELKHGIEFRSVDFGYGLEQLVLNNITFTIECGKTTALVGASGAGKSTLADLLPRFYDPTAGHILIDGQELREFDVSSLRQRMAIVSQDTFIFNDTVRNNIAYSLEDVSDDRVWEAAKLANAVDFIQELPEGLDTLLGDRGVRLSGGQRQRIAIARALLRNPEILILDEATSALDSVSERLIQESIEKLSVGRTVIAIAHRLSTIVRADKVVVLDQGRIAEQGSYQELLSKRGKLWKYHQMQHEMSQTT
ncbi:MAG: ABC transporter ATP-binding protein [Elainellaceae cyanobacterium]